MNDDTNMEQVLIKIIQIHFSEDKQKQEILKTILGDSIICSKNKKETLSNSETLKDISNEIIKEAEWVLFDEALPGSNGHNLSSIDPKTSVLNNFERRLFLLRNKDFSGKLFSALEYVMKLITFLLFNGYTLNSLGLITDILSQFCLMILKNYLALPGKINE